MTFSMDMDLNASPVPDDDEQQPYDEPVEVEYAQEEHVESAVATLRREREERRKRLKREQQDDGSRLHSQQIRNDYAPQPKRHSRFKEAPQGWLDCPAFGEPIDKIIPSKVPLDETFNESVPPGKRYSSKQLVNKQRKAGREKFTMAAPESLSWSDLPPELLGLVLRPLPSLADSVRVRAVCHPWRSIAQLQSLPPPLPWLTLPDGTFLSIPDGEIIRMAVPDDARCYGSIDNWLLLMQRDGGCSLMNPFSKATLDLPKLATVWREGWFNALSQFNPLFYKVVVPSPLDTSPESLVAVLILDDGNYSRVCICQPPVATDMTRTSRGGIMEPSMDLDDVAFFNGKLYGVAFGDRLLMFEIGYDLVNKPKISSTEFIINSMDAYLRDFPRSLSREEVHTIREYVVECCDRLLMVKRFIHNVRPIFTGPFFEHHRTVGFAVFEADLSTNPGQWRRVNKLGGQALFIGRHCSKSFAVEEFNGIQEDCIYFMCDYARPDPGDPLRDSGVYNIRNGTITPLLSQNALVLPQHNGGRWRPTWIFPADPI